MLMPEDSQDMEKSQAGLFRMYLAASDCLVQFEGDGSRDTSITVRVSCRPRDTPTVEAAWVPDTLSFKDLHESPREGQEFCLIPQYHSKTAFNSTRTPTNIRYSIELKQVPLSWLSWDDEIAGTYMSWMKPYQHGLQLRCQTSSMSRFRDHCLPCTPKPVSHNS